MQRQPAPFKIVFSTPQYGDIVEEMQENEYAHIAILGGSGHGKTEFLQLLPCILGEEYTYVDCRSFHTDAQLYRALCEQLEIAPSLAALERRTMEGGINFLFDEYWAGRQMAEPFVSFAASYNNRIVTVAGIPSLDSVSEYTLPDRSSE